MEKVNLADFSELLFFAESIGINWNKAHEILVDEGLLPEDGAGTKTWDLSDVLDEEWNSYSQEFKDILVGFMNKHDVKYFTITLD